MRIAEASGKRGEGIFTARESNRVIGGGIDMLDAQEKGYLDTAGKQKLFGYCGFSADEPPGRSHGGFKTAHRHCPGKRHFSGSGDGERSACSFQKIRQRRGASEEKADSAFAELDAGKGEFL